MSSNGLYRMVMKSDKVTVIWWFIVVIILTIFFFFMISIFKKNILLNLITATMVSDPNNEHVEQFHP